MSIRMHWWQTHSSSSSPSYADDNFINHKNDTRASKLISLFSDLHGDTYGYLQRRRLTRARKLRHLTDNDICHAPPRLMVEPVPLPLPELEVLFEHDAPAANHTFIMPSQKYAHKKVGENRPTSNVYRGDSKGFQRPDHLRYKEDTSSQNGGVYIRNGHMYTGSFSAPTSPISSPLFNSPTNISEMSTPYHMPPSTLPIWPSPETPTLDMTLGVVSTSLMYPDPYIVDSSPTHSPGQKSALKSSIRSNSRLHRNTLHENPMGRRDTNAQPTLATGHPLPLPPGANTSMSSSPPQVNSRHGSMPVTPRESQWQKGKLIGRGTFGSVYVGSNRETGALCAMKEVELLPDDPKAAECIKQLKQEIEVLSQLKHPNIVQYYGSEIVDDRFYIYLEYVHPGSINKYVRDHCGGMTESTYAISHAILFLGWPTCIAQGQYTGTLNGRIC